MSLQSQKWKCGHKRQKHSMWHLRSLTKEGKYRILKKGKFILLAIDEAPNVSHNGEHGLPSGIPPNQAIVALIATHSSDLSPSLLQQHESAARTYRRNLQWRKLIYFKSSFNRTIYSMSPPKSQEWVQRKAWSSLFKGHKGKSGIIIAGVERSRRNRFATPSQSDQRKRISCCLDSAIRIKKIRMISLNGGIRRHCCHHRFGMGIRQAGFRYVIITMLPKFL